MLVKKSCFVEIIFILEIETIPSPYLSYQDASNRNAIFKLDGFTVSLEKYSMQTKYIADGVV